MKTKEEIEREMEYLERLMTVSDGKGVEFRTERDLEVRYDWSIRYTQARQALRLFRA